MRKKIRLAGLRALLKYRAMKVLAQKRIILGITGGIAAYKSAELLRRLREHDAEVQVVMTSAATEFIRPLTFQALSGKAVRLDLFDNNAEAAMSHIELARWADAILIAPASANTLAKLAQGFADNLLTTLCLASDAPIAVAPAMNRLMWANAATRENCRRLQDRGVTIIGPASGEQACGEFGEGRMLEVSDIVDSMARLFQHGALAGKRVLITAGPTREALDPVRFLSNRSSGKMAYALAQAASDAGAAVQIISGPVALPTPSQVQRIDVETAEQMHAATLQAVGQADIFIACAAVADYRLARPAVNKIKKQTQTLELRLEKTPDILSVVANLTKRPFCVGFAAETEDLIKHAREKLLRKNLDMMVANLVGPEQGFEQDNNSATVLWRDSEQSFDEMPKPRLARHIIRLLAERIHQNQADTAVDTVN